jgi:ABC-type transport system substrate-binding protein
MDEYKKQVKDAYNATQNTPAMIAARERWKAEKLKKAQELKDEYYYNNKNEIFQVKIWYVTGPQSTEYYANYIDTALRLLGVKTELIPFGPKDIQSLITSGERNYDILVIGVSVEWSLSSIGKLFLSSESKTSWVNFSNVENKTLDSLFTALRSTTEPSKREKIEQNIEKIMNTESFFLPISSPYHRIWVDRNIKWIPKVDIIPDVASFVDIFIGTSIKENYVRNMQDKSISGFFLWIWSKL